MMKCRLAAKFTWMLLLVLAALCGSAMADPGTRAFDEAMKPILNDYLAIQRALAADSTEGVSAAAAKIELAAKNLDTTTLSGEHAQHYRNLAADIGTAATALARSQDLEGARDAFKDLSKPMAMWGTISKPAGIDVMFCAMAKANWLQEHGKPRNPYYGASMSGCGEVVGAAAQPPPAPKEHEEHGAHHMGH